MVDIAELTKSMNDLANDLKNEKKEEEQIPLQETPEKQWWHISDILTRQDELLEQILLAIRELKEPVVTQPTPPPISPIPPPTEPIPPIPENLLGKVDTLINLITNIDNRLKNLPTGKRTKILNFNYEVETGQTVTLADRVPFNGAIIEVVIEFPGGCNSLVDVSVKAGTRGVIPQVGYISLNNVTPTFKVYESVVIGEEIDVEIRNRDTINTHSIEINVTIMEK